MGRKGQTTWSIERKDLIQSLREVIFKEIMAENIPYLMKNTHLTQVSWHD